jgi:hypothetical protein
LAPFSAVEVTYGFLTRSCDDKLLDGSKEKEMGSEPIGDTLAADAGDTGREDAGGASRREMLERLGRFAYVAPALTLLAEPSGALADYCKPGNGFGDKNQCHSGPPGRDG